MKRIITSQDDADPLGPYSHATATESTVYTAGQIPVTPDGDVLRDAPIETQTRQSLSNIERILGEVDLGMEHVLKTTVYLTDIETMGEMNEAYTDFFSDDPPARTALEVAAIADGAGIEIEAVATRE